MGKEFEVVFEGEFAATPEQVWQAITAEEAAWLFPTDGVTGDETVVDPPRHHISRVDGPDGFFNQLEQVIEERPGGRSHLRWVHSGVFDADWATQYDAVTQHTNFYMHTLGEYLEHFRGRPVVFADIQAPDASASPRGFEALKTALGVTAATAAGDPVRADLPGVDAPAVVDFIGENFVGLRTDDALYRFFGRNAFGGPVGVTVHHFGGADAERLSRQWQEWLDALW